ncbi:proline-rich receptor-like protein kinase PERK9 [Vigna angularis]|uniref:proline-rich receptor-like protein kinase PERK9 n=1 Tax=Phaseolus angularis TaxID=3914 RepID=UPI0022B2BAEF|nr:proline-rich receptor-like protein kinase PERK9 [Vigna angularis]
MILVVVTILVVVIHGDQHSYSQNAPPTRPSPSFAPSGGDDPGGDDSSPSFAPPTRPSYQKISKPIIKKPTFDHPHPQPPPPSQTQPPPPPPSSPSHRHRHSPSPHPSHKPNLITQTHNSRMPSRTCARPNLNASSHSTAQASQVAPLVDSPSFLDARLALALGLALTLGLALAHRSRSRSHSPLSLLSLSLALARSRSRSHSTAAATTSGSPLSLNPRPQRRLGCRGLKGLVMIGGGGQLQWRGNGMGRNETFRV